MPLWSLLAALLAVAVLFLSSCSEEGGKSDGASDNTETSDETTDESSDETTTTEDETTTTSEVDDDAQARAESVDLEASDFGPDWEATPTEDDDEGSPLDDCHPSFTSDEGELATFTDDTFQTGIPENGVDVRVETKVFEDEATASDAIAPFGDDAVLECIDEGLKTLYTGDGGTLEGTFAAEDYGDTTVDEVLAASGEFTYTDADGVELPVSIGVAVLRVGDVATQVVVQAFGDATEEIDLGDPLTQLETLLGEA